MFLSPSLSPVDSSDLSLAWYTTVVPDGGAVHNSSERCPRWYGEVASRSSLPSLYQVRLGRRGVWRTPQNCLILEGRRKRCFPFPMSLSVPENEIPLSPRLVSHRWPEGSRKAFLCLLTAVFSRFPSLSFITHLCLHLALSGVSLTLLSPFTLLPFLYSSSLPPAPPCFFSVLSPFSAFPFSSPALHIALSSFRFYQVHWLGTLWVLREHHDSARGWLLPGLGGKLAFSPSAAWLPACSFTARWRGQMWGTSAMPTSGIWEAHRVDLFGASQESPSDFYIKV